MPVRVIEPHPYIADTAGRMAIARGPILYCVEAADHPGINLRHLCIPRNAQWNANQRHDLLGGIVTLNAPGKLKPIDSNWSNQLYRTANLPDSAKETDVALTAIPYNVWANPAAGAMRVWLATCR